MAGSAAVLRRLEVAVRANTDHFEKGMRGVSRTMRAVGAGLGAISASAQAQEKNWLNLGATIVTAFAAGGPVIGAITAVGAAVGIMIGKSKEAEEQWKKSFASMQAETEKLAKAAEASADRLFASRGGSLLARDFAERLDAAREAARAAVQKNIEIQKKYQLGDFGGYKAIRPGLLEDATRAADAAEETIRQRDALLNQARNEMTLLMERLEAEARLAGFTDQRARAFEEINLKAREHLLVLQQMGQAGVMDPEQIDAMRDSILRWTEAMRNAVPEVKPAIEEASGAMRDFADLSFQALDGIIIRGGRVADVFRQIALQIASSALRNVTNIAFGVESP